jgi:hypothetical protein
MHAAFIHENVASFICAYLSTCQRIHSREDVVEFIGVIVGLHSADKFVVEAYGPYRPGKQLERFDYQFEIFDEGEIDVEVLEQRKTFLELLLLVVFALCCKVVLQQLDISR